MNKGVIIGSREAGAVLNKKNRSALKTALDTIMSVLKNAGIDLTAEDSADQTDNKEGASLDDRIIEAAGFSVGDLAILLQSALDETREPADNPDMYVPPLRIVDIFDDHFVYCEGWAGVTFYRVDFTVTEDGVVTLGTPTFVIRKVNYITPGASAQESASDPGVFDLPLIPGAPVHLCESAIAADGTVKIKLIDANRWGSTGFYSADVLKRDGAAAFPIGTKMYIDHDTPAEEAARPEGTITRLAATFTTAAQYEDDPKHGAGLYAMAKVREILRTDLDDIAPAIGTSIRASGKATLGEAQGKRGPIITALTPSKFNRVDFVTIPGAGGKLVPLFESLRNRAQDDSATANSVVVIEADQLEGDHTMTDEQIKKLVSDGIAAAMGTALPAALQEALAPIVQQTARLSEAATLREAEVVVTAHLGKISGLPAITRQRLTPIIVREATITDGKLDTASLLARADQLVRDEAVYIESIGGARIVGLGESAPADQPGDDATEAAFSDELTGIFSSWGLSESAAKIAARGRAA